MRKFYAIAANAVLNKTDERWLDYLHRCSVEVLPSGSGFDGETAVDLARSTPDKLIIRSEFHKMNEGGYYDGWETFRVEVSSSLLFGVVVKVVGVRDPSLREYIGDVFQAAVEAEPKESFLPTVTVKTVRYEEVPITVFNASFPDEETEVGILGPVVEYLKDESIREVHRA